MLRKYTYIIFDAVVSLQSLSEEVDIFEVQCEKNETTIGDMIYAFEQLTSNELILK